MRKGVKKGSSEAGWAKITCAYAFTSWLYFGPTFSKKVDFDKNNFLPQSVFPWLS